jgi:hypothetical protein
MDILRFVGSCDDLKLKLIVDYCQGVANQSYSVERFGATKTSALPT